MRLISKFGPSRYPLQIRDQKKPNPYSQTPFLESLTLAIPVYDSFWQIFTREGGSTVYNFYAHDVEISAKPTKGFQILMSLFLKCHIKILFSNIKVFYGTKIYLVPDRDNIKFNRYRSRLMIFLFNKYKRGTTFGMHNKITYTI